MLRRAISTLALTAVLAAPAAAQTGPHAFWFNGVGDTPGGTFEGPFGTWEGSWNNDDWFQVFCVDFDHTIGHPTDNFDVWVTPFGAANTTYIENGAGAWANYRQAAQFASLMTQPHALSVTVQTDLQRAIWYSMGYGPANAVWLAAYNNYLAAASAIVISDADWYVINGEFGGLHRQELIAFRANPPQETVPEPATMTLLATGLAGMAAARRRNKKS